jgi:hypothetical protein
MKTTFATTTSRVSGSSARVTALKATGATAKEGTLNRFLKILVRSLAAPNA